jgi:replicative DNA helicase
LYELNLLKAFLVPEIYTKYRNYISKKDFPKELQYILEGIDAWYKQATDGVSVEDLSNIVIARGIPATELELVNAYFNEMKNANGSHTVEHLLERVKDKAVLQQVAVAAMAAIEGRAPKETVINLLESIKAPVIYKVEYVTDDLDEILNTIVKTKGLRWRLNSLNKALGSLRLGDFGFLFARPETGKTTFLASEITFMASQLQEEDGPILWFNNEEQSKKVKLRLYQAALGARLDQLLKDPARARDAYIKRTHGKIRLVDASGMGKREVESIIAQTKPKLAVFDQLDKVSGFKSDRDDLKLGDIYQWARELASLELRKQMQQLKVKDGFTWGTSLEPKPQNKPKRILSSELENLMKLGLIMYATSLSAKTNSRGTKTPIQP